MFFYLLFFLNYCNYYVVLLNSEKFQRFEKF